MVESADAIVAEVAAEVATELLVLERTASRAWQCENGHALIRSVLAPEHAFGCSECGVVFHEPGRVHFGCRACDFDFCAE